MAHAPLAVPPSISNAAWLRAPATQQVFAALIKGGHGARAVGGCVRNSLFAVLSDAAAGEDVHPLDVTDIDIATTATPEDTIRLASAAGLRTVPTGLEHGTVTVIAEDAPYEVTTLRRDVATDGRHATVAFTDDWALDASRRDFTMNALYADADGIIFDPLGGYDDLRRRHIRFIGDPMARIQEDYLRILRFFRFFAQYGSGAPDQDGLGACLAARAGLATLSAERIRHELFKLLAAPGADETCHIMFGHGLLTEVLPAAPNLALLVRLIERDPLPDAALRLAALTTHVEDDASRLTTRLRLSRTEMHTIRLTAATMQPRHAHKPTPKQARRLLYEHGPETYARLIKLYWAMRSDSASDEEWAALLALPENWRPPSFPVDGRDLIDLGQAEGPALGELIAKLQTSWLMSDFARSREALLTDASAIINKQK